jgi:large subunit ribosomal protein L4
MKVTVKNIAGKDTGKKINLDDSVFGIKPNDHAIYLDTKQYMANNRQGTHKTKERSEITGSTRKIKRQKGTGTARAGSIKSPIFRGGGRTFGPKPLNHGFKLNKKVKQLARKSALSYKAKNKDIIVVEDFHYDTPRTREFAGLNSNLNIENKKSLFVLAEPDKNIYLSSRNLKDSKVVTVSEITTYDILWASTLILVESSVSVLHQTLCA